MENKQEADRRGRYHSSRDDIPLFVNDVSESSMGRIHRCCYVHFPRQMVLCVVTQCFRFFWIDTGES